ncbi:DUF3021 domain-containing protein [Lysinibacillus cavernae]|uniref:DUF3021 domain-containing protein n=1 Tax=Lysinibacillus cavernae TaxID=2666135 RepID=UPI0012D9B73B|nr:DUF3021 domain-containing protein [Lysinibacillus cavernae]
MRKELFTRVIGGFVIGVALGQIVQFFISMGIGQGDYVWVVPEFRAIFTNEGTAIITQVLLTGVIGLTFALAALIFEMARWGMLKQYIIHFFVTAIIWIPIVTLLWMPKTMANVISLLASFLGTYIITWVLQYKFSQRDIEKINAVLSNGGEDYDD